MTTGVLGTLEALVAVSALGGGIALLSALDGSNLGLTTDDLADTPFDDYLVPVTCPPN